MVSQTLYAAAFQDILDAVVVAVFLGLFLVHSVFWFLALRRGEQARRARYGVVCWADGLLVFGGLLGIGGVYPNSFFVEIAGVGLMTMARAKRMRHSLTYENHERNG